MAPTASELTAEAEAKLCTLACIYLEPLFALGPAKPGSLPATGEWNRRRILSVAYAQV